MKTHPMLFSGPMVRALLDGIKTQTRRVLKPQPVDGARFSGFEPDGQALFTKGSYYGKVPLRIRVGDMIWVRETWQCLSIGDYLPTDHQHCALRYRASDRLADVSTDVRGYPWRPSIHMPRWASRLTLEITDVRVQRLQDISEEDAIAEGIEPHYAGWMPYNTIYYETDGVTPAVYLVDPCESYRQLWDSLHGVGAWGANPWVTALTFKIHKTNIDQFLEAHA